MTNLTVLTMNSKEIAELTGKLHKHVLRDVRNMLDTVHSEGGPNLGYQSIQGVTLTVCEFTGRTSIIGLDRRHTDCLLTGYSAKARMKVIDRWHELEAQVKQPQPDFYIPQTYGAALQLCADQANALELAKPKVAFVDNLVDKSVLMNATQVGQKHGLSAIKLNKFLVEWGVYNGSVKRGKAFKQWFIDGGYGEMKQTEMGYSQALFTNAGEVRIHELLIQEGIV